MFETANDNNAFRNLDVFSTNFFAYHGYVGEGSCGSKCNLSGLDAAVDLVDKAISREAAAAMATPNKGAGAAYRGPAEGFRWFVILLEAKSRTVQLAMVHPDRLPPSMAIFAAAQPAKGRKSCRIASEYFTCPPFGTTV